MAGHTLRSDEVAYEIVSEVEDMGGRITPRVRVLLRSWRIVTGSIPMDNGEFTPALVNAAARHWKKFGSS